MNHVCPGVPKGADCVLYSVETDSGHEAGVEADGVRRLRHEFVGKRSREAAESYTIWMSAILGRYCQVGEISFDMDRQS